MKIKIKSVETELAACRKAWVEAPDAKLAWCCHHAVELETLTEPAENRIAYILSCKRKEEQAIRLHNFRPARINLPEAIEKARAEYYKVRAEFDKACAEWNKACAELDKARAEWDKAGAEWNKVIEYHKSELSALHNQDWPDNTWNGENIFGEA